MSQGRPSNPSTGTQRPGTPSRAEVGKGAEASKPPEASTPGTPTDSGPAATSNPSPAGAAKPASPPPSTGGQPAGKPAAQTSQPSGGKPTDNKSADGKPVENKPVESRPSVPKAGDSRPGAGATAGGRPTTSGTGGGQPGGQGPSSPGSGGTGSGGPGSGGPTPPAAAAPAAAAPASRGGGYVAGLVGGVVGAALAVFGAPLVQGPPPLAPAAESRLGAIESLADNLEPEVRAAVEAAVAEVPSRDGAAIAALAEEVAALASNTAAVDTRLSETTERIETLDAELQSEMAAAGADIALSLEETREAASEEVGAAQAALGGELEALRGQLAAAEAKLAAVQDQVAASTQARRRAAAAALLVRDIDQSIDSGAPFAEPLGYLLSMAEDDATLTATLDDLRPYAERGVPTMQGLRDSLLALAETEAPAEIAGSEFIGQAVQNLYGLVQVRSKEDETGIALGLLANADSALRAGEIETAIVQVEAAVATPDGVDPDLAADWLADARARLAAIDARVQLDAHIRELLTASID